MIVYRQEYVNAKSSIGLNYGVLASDAWYAECDECRRSLDMCSSMDAAVTRAVRAGWEWHGEDLLCDRCKQQDHYLPPAKDRLAVAIRDTVKGRGFVSVDKDSARYVIDIPGGWALGIELARPEEEERKPYWWTWQIAPGLLHVDILSCYEEQDVAGIIAALSSWLKKHTEVLPYKELP